MFSFLIGFLSSFSLPFSRFLFCVSFAVSSSRSLSLPPSTVSLSSFLPSFLCFVLYSSSVFFSFPLLLFLPSPIPLPLFRSRCGLFFFLGFMFPFCSAFLSVSSSLLDFGHLLASPFVLSPCPLFFSLLLVVYSCLLSPVGQWVLQGLHVLACPCVRGGGGGGGGLFPGLSLFCVFGLYRFGSLPSFLPLLLLRCLKAWWLFFPLGGLLCMICCLSKDWNYS